MFYLIKIRPDILRRNAQLLRHTSSQLRDICSRVGNAYNRMQTEARCVARMDSEVHQAQSRAAKLAEDALQLAMYLETKANAFEQADQWGANLLDQTISPQVQKLVNLQCAANSQSSSSEVVDVALMSAILATLRSPSHWDDSLDKSENLLNLRDAIRNILRARKELITDLKSNKNNRYSYSIKGGNTELREALGLARTTGKTTVVTGLRNVFHPQNLEVGIRLANRQTVDTLKSWSFRGLVVLSAGINAWKNWEDYKNDKNAVIRTATATVTDTTLAVGLGLAGQWGGAVVGGSIGAAIGGPIGAVIGSQIGGFVGGFAGSMAAEWISEQSWYKTGVEWVADQSAEAVKNVIDSGTKVVSDVKNAIQEQSRRVSDGIQAIGNTISNFFKPRSLLWG